MTPTEPRPTIVVRVDEVLAGEHAGLLHYGLRERIDEVVEGATKRWGVDPAAVTVEFEPVPSLLQLREPTPDELAEVERRWLKQFRAAGRLEVLDTHGPVRHTNHSCKEVADVGLGPSLGGAYVDEILGMPIVESDVVPEGTAAVASPVEGGVDVVLIKPRPKPRPPWWRRALAAVCWWRE
jgi:hypothetical protein